MDKAGRLHLRGVNGQQRVFRFYGKCRGTGVRQISPTPALEIGDVHDAQAGDAKPPRDGDGRADVADVLQGVRVRGERERDAAEIEGRLVDLRRHARHLEPAVDARPGLEDLNRIVLVPGERRADLHGDALVLQDGQDIIEDREQVLREVFPADLDLLQERVHPHVDRVLGQRVDDDGLERLEVLAELLLPMPSMASDLWGWLCGPAMM
jgi:hypothetical protein